MAKKNKELELYRNPVWYARKILGHDTWKTQEAILESVANHRATAVKACHSSGKTFTAAEAVLWWITKFSDGIAVTTAPTWTQVEKLLWGEIHKNVETSLIPYPQPNRTELRLSAENYAIGISTDQGVRFQGWHGRILIVIDEATGVKPDIWEAIEGIRAGGNVHVLALGNPTVASGVFYDAFTRDRERWNTITISAFDTPNLEGLTIDDLRKMDDAELDRDERSYLTKRRWVLEKFEQWGETSPLYQSRVLGNFPDQSEDALISLAWIDKAKGSAADDGTPVTVGVDVAGPGEDETVVCVLQGNSVIGLAGFYDADSRGKVARYLQPFRNRIERLSVDTIGIGEYFGRHLADLGFKVNAVNVGRPPHNKAKFKNLKAELYWNLREAFSEGNITGINDDALIGQLSAIQYGEDSRGRIEIESKEKLIKRGVKSPDRAEALMLAFAPNLNRSRVLKRKPEGW